MTHFKASEPGVVTNSDDHTRRLVVTANERWGGLDFTWRFWSPKDEEWCDSPVWGNARDAAAGKSLIDDLRDHGYEFIVEPIAADLLRRAFA